jgi:hypothetical protein
MMIIIIIIIIIIIGLYEYFDQRFQNEG